MMVKLNFMVIALAALIPMVMGFIWYHKALFGRAWQKEVGITDAQTKEANMAKMLIGSYVLSFMLALILSTLVIHQFGVQSMLNGAEGDQAKQILDWTSEYFMGNHRNFGHGAFHGFFIGLLLVLPVMWTNGLFELRSTKLTLINGGYWLVSISIMGGVLCQFS